MGDVAASGGYYVAAAADEIFAGASTITGSIGVFVPKFDASELYGKLGLHFETVKRGKSADLFGTTRGLIYGLHAQGWHSSWDETGRPSALARRRFAT